MYQQKVAGELTVEVVGRSVSFKASLLFREFEEGAVEAFVVARSKKAASRIAALDLLHMLRERANERQAAAQIELEGFGPDLDCVGLGLGVFIIH